MSAKPLIEYASKLRVPIPLKSIQTTRNAEPFSFYQKDMEKLENRTSKSLSPTKRTHIMPSPREKCLQNILDVEIKGNTGTVFLYNVKKLV